MALDPRKRQKKLERRKARQKAYQKEVAAAQSAGIASHLREAASGPILHCCVADTVFAQGLGSVLISRLLRSGDVAFVIFLVDVNCLGVKDVAMAVRPRHEYQERTYNHLNRSFRMREFTPACARKLVEGGVAYAADLGLSPHPDYRIAQLIFGDVDAAACEREFTYGKDGKPFFVAGPYDGPARCHQVMKALASHRQPNEYHYIVPVRPGESIEGFEIVPVEDQP